MGQILRGLLWSAAVSRGADAMKLSLRRARRRFALVAAGVACALAAAGFLLAAGFMELADRLGAMRASVIIGAALAVASALLIIVARRRAGTPSTDPALHDDPSPVATTMIGVGRDIGAAAARHPGSFVLAAFLAGLFLGGGRTRR